MDFLEIIGRAQIEQAGRNMAGAADAFNQAINRMSDRLDAHERFLTDFLERLEKAMQPQTITIINAPAPALPPPLPSPWVCPSCQQPALPGHCCVTCGD